MITDTIWPELSSWSISSRDESSFFIESIVSQLNAKSRILKDHLIGFKGFSYREEQLKRLQELASCFLLAVSLLY